MKCARPDCDDSKDFCPCIKESQAKYRKSTRYKNAQKKKRAKKREEKLVQAANDKAMAEAMGSIV